MLDQAIKKPRISQGWLRLAAFGGCFCIITLLVAIPAVVILADIPLKDLWPNPIPTLAGQLTGPHLWLMLVLELVISLISVGCFRIWIDRKSMGSLGLEYNGYATESVTGLFMGPALLGIVALLLLVSGHLAWVDIVWDPSSLGVSLGFMVLIAISEELVFRGYVLGNLLDWFDQQSPDGVAPETNKWLALGVSALLFAAFHATNPGIHTLAFLNLFLAGLLLGVNYIYTRNLWFSICFHLSWNFFQGPIMGFRVSGLSLPSLLQIETKGDLFLTGGDFGLEGSILNTAVSLIAILVLIWAFGRKYRSGRAMA